MNREEIQETIHSEIVHQEIKVTDTYTNGSPNLTNRISNDNKSLFQVAKKSTILNI